MLARMRSRWELAPDQSAQHALSPGLACRSFLPLWQRLKLRISRIFQLLPMAVSSSLAILPRRLPRVHRLLWRVRYWPEPKKARAKFICIRAVRLNPIAAWVLLEPWRGDLLI